MKRLLYFLSALSVFAADVKVRDLSITTVTPASNDYILVDGTIHGTSKNLLNNFAMRTDTRATLAAMSVTGVATGTAAITLSGTTLGDNGGGLYYYDAASSATADGINIIQPTVGTGRWLISRNGFVTGLGTMSTQNANAVTITGGTISVPTLASTVATGTPPLTVASTTLVPNLYVARALTADNATGSADAGTLTGTTLASNVVSSSLTSVGTLGSLTVGPITSSSLANTRTTKTNFNLVRNVKDYGAVGDGTTNDNAAIAAAIAALTDDSVLYFPPGRYRTTAGWDFPGGLDRVEVTGNGATILNDSGAAGGNTFAVGTTCTSFNFHNLRYVGTSTVRGNGVHIRMAANNSRVTNNYFERSSDFALLISGETSYVVNVLVANNVIYQSLGDGIHVGTATDVVVSGNAVYETGDDGIAAVCDNVPNSPTRVSIIGNIINRPGYGPAAVSGEGIRIYEVVDVLVANNQITSPYQTGIEVGRYTSTTDYNDRVSIIGNKILNANNGIAGARGAIWLNYISIGNISGNTIEDTTSGSGIAFLDISETTISGNFLRRSPSRGIACDDSTVTNVGASWSNITITNNNIDWTQANESIYVVPPTGKAINGLIISGNVGTVMAPGHWINYGGSITNGRIFNNTQTGAATVAAASGSVTVGNNN